MDYETPSMRKKVPKFGVWPITIGDLSRFIAVSGSSLQAM